MFLRIVASYHDVGQTITHVKTDQQLHSHFLMLDYVNTVFLLNTTHGKPV